MRVSDFSGVWTSSWSSMTIRDFSQPTKNGGAFSVTCHAVPLQRIPGRQVGKRRDTCDAHFSASGWRRPNINDPVDLVGNVKVSFCIHTKKRGLNNFPIME
jgi:hypothetical protein